MKKKIQIKTEGRDEIFERMPGWDQEKVRNARIMVVGAGALGNEVLKNLALLNVKQVVIVDFDFIERSNLSRSVLFRESDCTGTKMKALVAAERVREINPEMRIVTIRGDIGVDVGLGVFRRMDAIIGCLDNRIARLYLNRISHKAGKVWVNGGILNLAGQVSVYKPGVSCYECELTPNDWKHIRFRMGCTDIAQRNSLEGHVPTSPIAASMMGAMQVQEALKVVLGQDAQSMAGKRFYYDGQHNVAKYYGSLPIREDCLSHFEYEEVIEAKELSAENTVGEVLAALAERFGTQEIRIDLDHTLLTGIATLQSKKEYELVIPKPHFSEKIGEPYLEIPGEAIGFPPEKMVDRIGMDFAFQGMKMREIGIPGLHVISVRVDGERHFVELSGDAHLLAFETAMLDLPFGTETGLG